MIVSSDGFGDFKNITEAINRISEHNEQEMVIYLKKGTYTEKLLINKPNITLVGEDLNETIITYGDYALKQHCDGTDYGTFRSYSVFIGADYFTAKNITFVNSAGMGSKVGQAIAVYADASYLHFKNCQFIGYQDTLFTGPLPPSPIIQHSFKGPREFAVRRNGLHYYERCYIQGDIDFIFGSATAYFYQCEIVSNDLNRDVNGHITAASTPFGQPYGYVFESCHLKSEAKPNTVYLGRPWRNHAHVAFLNCYMEAHIKLEGFDDWDKLEARHTVTFAEYNSSGPGGNMSKRVSYAKKLTEDEAKHYSRDKVLAGWSLH